MTDDWAVHNAWCRAHRMWRTVLFTRLLFFFFLPEVIWDNPLLMKTRGREHWFDCRLAVGLSAVLLPSL